MRFSNLLLVAFSTFTPGFQAMAAITGKDLFSGKVQAISQGAKGTVIVFMSATCPCSNSHTEILRKIADEFKEFSFLVVHSNADESLDKAKSYFGNLKFPFPVLQDEGFKLADEFKANKTPHAFVISNDGKIIFRGGITNSTEGESADKNFLRDALLDVRNGRAVRVAQSRSLGCAISR